MVCLLFLVLAAAEPATPAVPPAKQADIRRLMTLTATAQLPAQITQQMTDSFKAAFPKAPDAVWNDLKKQLTPNELLGKIEEVYDRHFTHDEIKGLIAFYETPLGKKLLTELPAVNQDSLEVGQTWGRAMGEKYMKGLEAKGYRLPPPK